MKLSLIFVCLFAVSGVAQSVQVKTAKGIVEGEKFGSIHRFLGIPFAQPPMGDLRWKAPQDLANWQGVKSVKAYGPSPMQAEPKPFMVWSEEYLIPKEPISEDCLYLNVWNDSKEKGPKPVLVYIYGGGFRSGGAACAACVASVCNPICSVNVGFSGIAPSSVTAPRVKGVCKPDAVG